VPGGVIEEPSRETFTNARVIVIVDAEFCIIDLDLDAFAQPRELLLDVSRPLHGLELDEVLEAELPPETRISPLVEHVEEGEMVPSRSIEVLLSIICVDLLLLWSIEHTIPD
jgi:hypothetical protein